MSYANISQPRRRRHRRGAARGGRRTRRGAGAPLLPLARRAPRQRHAEMVGPQRAAAVRIGTHRAVGRLRRYRAVGLRIVQPDVARSRRADARTQMGGRTALRRQDRRRVQLRGAAAERRSARVQLSELPRFAARHHDRGARSRSRRARHARGVEARRVDVPRADGVRRNRVDFRRDDDVPISAASTPRATRTN